VPYDLLFPAVKRKPGRMPGAVQTAYDKQLAAFARDLLAIQATMDFKAGVRGWAYILENRGDIAKGDFDKAEGIITELRKAGGLPLDFCAEDDTRAARHLEELDEDEPEEYAREWLERIIDTYTPVSFWDYQECYSEMWVEKIDLVELFDPICRKYHVPLSTTRGWYDLNMRGAAAKRFARHEAAGRECTILSGGDLDPPGRQITRSIKKGFAEIKGATGWDPEGLEVERFCLKRKFIDDNKLPWINGLMTSSGRDLADPKHPDHYEDWVQDYIAMYGTRKCEANALVVRPREARRLCEETILSHLSLEGIKGYEEALAEERWKVQEAVGDILRRGGSS
jgi:hypothetical protein